MVSPFGVDLEFCGLGLLSVAVTSTKKKKMKTDVSAITSNYETKLGGLLSSLVLLRSWSWPPRQLQTTSGWFSSSSCKMIMLTPLVVYRSIV